jgi:hypothetical protein
MGITILEREEVEENEENVDCYNGCDKPLSKLPICELLKIHECISRNIRAGCYCFPSVLERKERQLDWIKTLIGNASAFDDGSKWCQGEEHV